MDWDWVKIAIDIVIMLGIILVFGLLVMVFWNLAMPAIFGVCKINYGQAWCLVVLAKLLFGEFKVTWSNNKND